MPELWATLSALPPAVFLQRSSVAYLLVNAAHIASLAMLVGTMVSLDLRLLGAFRTVPLAVIGPFLSRMAAGGLILAVLTGAWLFSVNATEYVSNTAFLAKLCLVGLGVLNAVWLHTRGNWALALDKGQASPAVRLHAALSLGVWLGAVVAGRWIGFL